MAPDAIAPLDATRIEQLLLANGVQQLGQPLCVLDRTASTNDDALQAARRGARHGATFVASEQTAGRGRRGHRWLAPPGESLLFSVLVRPELALHLWAWLPLMAGLAVRNATQRFCQAVLRVKWPNDVVCRREKLAGILVESRIGADSSSSVGVPSEACAVVGIGLNVSTVTFPDEIAATATSLAACGASVLDRAVLLATILGEIETALYLLQRDPRSLLAQLSPHDALNGQKVRVGEHSGTARGFDIDGGLQLELPEGRFVSIRSGHVEWL